MPWTRNWRKLLSPIMYFFFLNILNIHIHIWHVSGWYGCFKLWSARVILLLFEFKIYTYRVLFSRVVRLFRSSFFCCRRQSRCCCRFLCMVACLADCLDPLFLSSPLPQPLCLPATTSVCFLATSSSFAYLRSKNQKANIFSWDTRLVQSKSAFDCIWSGMLSPLPLLLPFLTSLLFMFIIATTYRVSSSYTYEYSYLS